MATGPAVDEDLAGVVAADGDVVIEVVASHGEHAGRGGERGGDGELDTVFERFQEGVPVHEGFPKVLVDAASWSGGEGREGDRPDGAAFSKRCRATLRRHGTATNRNGTMIIP